MEDSLSAIVERLREGSNANQDTISVSRSHFLGVHTIEIINSESSTVPLKPFLPSLVLIQRAEVYIETLLLKQKTQLIKANEV